MKRALYVSMSQCRLIGQSKTSFDNVLNVCRGEAEISPGLVELICQLLKLFPQLPLKLQHLANWLGLTFCVGRIQSSTFSKHRLFDLFRDNGPDFPEVFPDCLNFDHCPQQKFQIPL